jgi:hypothetical protein
MRFDKFLVKEALRDLNGRRYRPSRSPAAGIALARSGLFLVTYTCTVECISDWGNVVRALIER